MVHSFVDLNIVITIPSPYPKTKVTLEPKKPAPNQLLQFVFVNNKHFFLQLAGYPEYVLAPERVEVESSVIVVLRSTNPYKDNQLFSFSNSYIRPASKPELTLAAGPQNRELKLALHEPTPKPQYQWQISQPGVDDKPYEIEVVLQRPPKSVENFPAPGPGPQPTFGKSSVIYIHPMDDINVAISVNKASPGQRCILHARAPETPQKWVFVYQTPDQFQIQLSDYPDLVLQPSSGQLKVEIPLILAPKSQNPLHSLVEKQQIGKHIQPVMDRTLCLSSVPGAEPTSVVLKMFQQDAREQLWQVSEPGKEELIELTPFIDSTKKPVIEITVLIYPGGPNPDKLADQKRLPPNPGKKVVFGPKTANQPNRFRIVIYIGLLFYIQLENSPDLVLQPLFGTLTPGTQVVLAPLGRNPKKDDQLFFVYEKSIRLVNKPDLALGYTSPTSSVRPSDLILVNFQQPGSNNVAWKFGTPPNTPTIVELDVFLTDLTKKFPNSYTPMRPNYPFGNQLGNVDYQLETQEKEDRSQQFLMESSKISKNVSSS
uniref:Uncharacterized protein n=1 Tax=Romanomermis culicivorax TaxID=13658 RepID=A0A915JI33_ROMCU